MTCESFEPRVALHVEGDLPADEAAGVEIHLRTCARCRGFAAELRESQGALKELRERGIDDAALETVRQRVRAGLDRRPRGTRPLVLASLAAAAVLIVTVLRLPHRPAGEEPGETTSRRPTDVAPPPAPLAPATPSRVEERAATRVAAAPKHVARPAATTRHITVEPPLPTAPDRVAHSEGGGEAVEETALVLKVPTSDPSVVIYWVVDPNGGPS